MDAMRIFWTCLLTICVTVGFYRSWQVEHGAPKAYDYKKSTAVWISPLYLPITLGGTLGVYVWIDGWRGFYDFFYLCSEIFLFMSIFYLIVLLLLPLLRRWISSRACATLWIIPVFLYYQLFMMTNSGVGAEPMVLLQIPAWLPKLIIPVWLVVGSAIMLWQVVQHFRFKRMLFRNSRELEEELLTDGIQELLEKMKAVVGVDLEVKLRKSEILFTPLAMRGRKKTQVIFLPNIHYNCDELELIFKHELHHIQRGDIETKIFLGFCKAFCWFNPLIWIAAAKGSEDLELSCDEVVLKDADEAQRENYAHLLLKTSGNATGFSTCLSASARSLKYRLQSVIQPKKRAVGAVLLGLTMLVACLSSGKIVFAEPVTRLSDIVSAEDIMEINYYYAEDSSGLNYESKEKIQDYFESNLADLQVCRMLTSRSIEVSGYPYTWIWLGYDASDRSGYVMLNQNMIEVRKYASSFAGGERRYYKIVDIK